MLRKRTLLVNCNKKGDALEPPLHKVGRYLINNYREGSFSCVQRRAAVS